IVNAAQVGIGLVSLRAVDARRIGDPAIAVGPIGRLRQVDDISVRVNPRPPGTRLPVIVAGETNVVHADVRQFQQVILLEGALNADIPVQRVGVVVVGGNYGYGGARRWRRSRGGDLSGGILLDCDERRLTGVDVKARRVAI